MYQCLRLPSLAIGFIVNTSFLWYKKMDERPLKSKLEWDELVITTSEVESRKVPIAHEGSYYSWPITSI